MYPDCMRALRDIVQSGALMPKNISRHAMVIRWPFWLDCTRRSNCCCESSRSLIARENRFSRNREKICELADGISVTRAHFAFLTTSRVRDKRSLLDTSVSCTYAYTKTRYAARSSLRGSPLDPRIDKVSVQVAIEPN
jgi:hypothetical protein